LLFRHVVGTDEAVVLIMAMRNSNMPKFLVDDAVLFLADILFEKIVISTNSCKKFGTSAGQLCCVT